MTNFKGIALRVNSSLDMGDELVYDFKTVDELIRFIDENPEKWETNDVQYLHIIAIEKTDFALEQFNYIQTKTQHRVLQDKFNFRHSDGNGEIKEMK